MVLKRRKSPQVDGMFLCYLLIFWKLLTLFLDRQLRKRTKKAKATDPPTKKAKAAGLSSKAKAAKAKAAGVEVISKQIIKYVHIVAFGKVINIPVSEILKKHAFLPKKTE
jgi:hypothetical protein